MSPDANRNRDVDLVRLAANLLVVLIHAFAAFQYCARGTAEFKFWMFVCNGVGSVALPALFVMSGYLMLRGTDGMPWRVYFPKMVRRVNRLLVPYIVWNVTFIAFYLISAQFVPRMHERVALFAIDTWRGALAKTLSLTESPIDMPLWYMRAVFVYALASPLLCVLLKRCRGVFAYLLAIVYLSVTAATGQGYRLEFSYPAYSLLLFVVGGHLAVREGAGAATGAALVRLFGSRRLWPVAGAGAVGLGLLFVRQWWDYSVWRDVCFVCAAPMLFLLLPLLRWGAALLPRGGFEFLQRSSFFLYCGHFLFCSVLLHSVAPLLRGMGCGKFTLLVGVFIGGGVGLCLLAHALGRRLLGRAFSLWDGTLK